MGLFEELQSWSSLSGGCKAADCQGYYVAGKNTMGISKLKTSNPAVLTEFSSLHIIDNLWLISRVQKRQFWQFLHFAAFMNEWIYRVATLYF